MANIKPTKLQMFNGLRRRPHYEEISQEINPDKTKIIYPNRDATRLRNDPRMTQMDGLGMFESLMEQQEATTREQRKETILADIAKDEGIGIKEVKTRPPPPPAPPPSQPASGSGANPRMPFAYPQSGPSGSGAKPRMPYTFEFGAGDPQTDHEAEIAEARNMSKQQRMTKQERNDAEMARHMAQQQDRIADLMKKQRQTDLDNRRTMPDENLSAADEAEATKSESDKPIPKKKEKKKTKKDAETKKPAVTKEEPEEVKEIKKEEEIKKELKEEFKKQKEEKSKSVPDKAMRERSKSRDAKSDPEPTPPRQKRRSKLERSRSRDPPPLPIPPKAKAKGRPKKEFVEDVKEEVAKIEKKQESSDPEVKKEPKGPRGRPRSTSRPPTTNAAASSSGVADTIDSTTSMTALGKHTVEYLLKQILHRGVQEKEMAKIRKKSKGDILNLIEKWMDEGRW